MQHEAVPASSHTFCFRLQSHVSGFMMCTYMQHEAIPVCRKLQHRQTESGVLLYQRFEGFYSSVVTKQGIGSTKSNWGSNNRNTNRTWHSASLFCSSLNYYKLVWRSCFHIHQGVLEDEHHVTAAFEYETSLGPIFRAFLDMACSKVCKNNATICLYMDK